MKVLMVCMGNICRSPLAEGVMQHLSQSEGLNWVIDSAGTGNWHIGESPDYRARRVAKDHGLDISTQKCRQFVTTDFDNFDLILAMDKKNLAYVWAKARNMLDKRKVRLLLNDIEVPDPYYTNTFDYCYELIEKGCRNIVEAYKQWKTAV